MRYFNKKIIIVLLIAAIIGLLYYFGFSEYFTLEALQANHQFLTQFVHHHYILSVGIYITLFSILVACGLPIVIPLAMMGGFLYGILLGILYAGLSCLIGSILSFLVLRYVILHWIKDWYTDRIDEFNKKIQKYGYSYLLLLHFLSVVPMFVINLFAVLAKIPLRTVIWVTLLGCLPMNVLSVITGQRLSSMRSFNDIFSPAFIITLIILMLIACIPLFFKKIKKLLGV
jgi:uncharacterized membrane protein YdjX (TVP38/TMEM64 family)